MGRAERARWGGRWTLSETVVLPSHTTLILRGTTLYLADSVGDNVLRNEAAKVEGVRDEEIPFVDFGNFRIDGNAVAQHGLVVSVDADQHAGNREYDYFHRNGINLYKVYLPGRASDGAITIFVRGTATSHKTIL